MIISRSYPRAALIGNPSDGYFGKTIAFVFSNFMAEVQLRPSERLEIIPQPIDTNTFADMESFSRHIEHHGYYGGSRLIKATIKRFFDYIKKEQLELHDQNFSIAYHSTIPMRLGLAGSSAIITACLKALLQFYKIKIPKPILANLILSVETEELKIAAGLQDRVAQVFEQPVFMDFDQKTMAKQGYGFYETFDANLLPDLYIAYFEKASEGSESVHNNLRERFEKREEKVQKAMRQFADLTDTLYHAMKAGNKEYISTLINQNFDLRASICPISPQQQNMIDLARAVGVSAKFTGSGGAIIGTYRDAAHFAALSQQLSEHQITVIKPKVVSNE